MGPRAEIGFHAAAEGRPFALWGLALQRRAGSRASRGQGALLAPWARTLVLVPKSSASDHSASFGIRLCKVSCCPQKFKVGLQNSPRASAGCALFPRLPGQRRGWETHPCGRLPGAIGFNQLMGKAAALNQPFPSKGCSVANTTRARLSARGLLLGDFSGEEAALKGTQERLRTTQPASSWPGAPLGPPRLAVKTSQPLALWGAVCGGASPIFPGSRKIS